MATQNQLFKLIYKDELWQDLVWQDKPFFAMLRKQDGISGFGPVSATVTGAGAGFIYTWSFGQPQGISGDYTTARAGQDALWNAKQGLAQTAQLYGAFRLDAKELAASQSKLGSYMESKRYAMDGVLRNMGAELDLMMHRAAGGVMAGITAVVGNVLTLSSVAQLQQFQVGMRIQNSTTSPVDGSAPALGAANAVVTRVSQVTTVSGYAISLTVDNVAGFAPGQFIVRAGNGLAATATTSKGSILGLNNWVPLVDPTPGENFLGVDRSDDIMRLSGVRTSGAGMTIREAIQANAALIPQVSGRTPDVVLMNPSDYVKLSLELQGSVRYETNTDLKVGFPSMLMPDGLRVFKDPAMQLGIIRLMTMDTWLLMQHRDTVHVIDEDGLTIRKDPGTDSFVAELRSWCQLFCTFPGANGVIIL